MISKINFPSIDLEDAFLDESGAKILETIETIFIKLELFELSSGEKRDLSMARELNEILSRTKELRQRYEGNVRDNQQVELLRKELE